MCSQRKSLPSIPALLATWLDWDMLEAVISIKVTVPDKVLPPLPRPPSHKHNGRGNGADRILAGAGRASHRKTCLGLLSEGPPFGAASPVEFEVGADGLRELNRVADGLHV